MISRQLIILFCFVITIGLIIGLVWPKYQTLKNVLKEIEFKKFELETKEEYFQNLAQISEKLKTHSENLSKINSALPADFIFPFFLLDLEEISSRSGLIFKGFGGLSSQPSENGIKKHSLSISLSGSYSSFKNFLSALENSARFIEIKEISFSSSQKEEAGPIFNFNLTIQTHSL